MHKFFTKHKHDKLQFTNASKKKLSERDCTRNLRFKL